MMKITLRYENGIFKSTSPVAGFNNGEEIDVIVPARENKTFEAQYHEMLDTTAGIWADIADELEAYIQESKEKSLQASMEKMKSLWGEENTWDKE